MSGLSVSDFVSVDVSLSPTLVVGRNFGAYLILGDSNVIDAQERMRQYGSIQDLQADFPSGPEYSAAALFFGQNPTPSVCYVGRWLSSPSAGLLRGGPLSATQQALLNFTAITAGSLDLVIDGNDVALTGMSFATAANLNGVAGIITTALAGAASVTWNPNSGQFTVTSSSFGAPSTVALGATGIAGNIASLLGLTQAAGATTVGGAATENIADAVGTMMSMSADWYGLKIASGATISDTDIISVAQLVEGAAPARILTVNTSAGATLLGTSTTDLAAQLKAFSFLRTYVQYSSATQNADAATMGIAFTVDFTGSNTTITLKFKQPAGVTPELLSETQAATLKAKNCNVVALYNNKLGILQEGVMASGEYFDVVHGADWLQNAIQTALVDLFISLNKVAQTDGGVTTLCTAVIPVLEQAVANGFLAPGVWTGPTIGPVTTGSTLTKGYAVYAPPLSNQTQADRKARKAPLIQIPVKLAGAFHSASVLVNVVP